MISRKGPDLARRARDCCYGGEEEQNDENASEHHRSCIRTSGAVQDDDDGVIRIQVHESPDVLDTEAEADQHGDAHDSVQTDTPHHGLGKLNRCILELFTHVRSCVGTDETPNWTRQADHDAESHCGPASAVVEIGEDIVGGNVVRHDPEGDEEGEEGEDVGEEDNSFGEREVMGAEDVEANSQEGEGEDDERDLPCSGEFGVGIRNGDHFLDHAGELQGARRYARDPADGRGPAYRVGEGFLQ